jgi:CBS domain-containing protein
MRCPCCAHENLPGADLCEECQTSLMHEEVTPREARTRIERSLGEDTVGCLEQHVRVVSVPEDTTLEAAVKTMRAERVGCLLVTDSDGRLTGIFTERDVLTKVALEVTDLSAHPVSRFMTHHPETIRPDHPLAHALQRMMVGDFRYLPLVDDEGRPTQITSSMDIVGHIASLVCG